MTGNTPAGKQVAGARNDPGTIGVNGNLWVDPAYVDPAAFDFHLSLGSPVIDKGNDSDASSIAITS